MSCNYAEGLSPYENKGVVGAAEIFDTGKKVKEKCEILADWLQSAKHVVFHTGAGISTSAGIPDFRGPNGVWTMEKYGKKPSTDISFTDAIPTKTHMAIKKLLDEKLAHYVISQNIDGLHLRSGVQRSLLAELHGNMFVEECNYCNSQFVRNFPTPTVGKKSLEIDCKRKYQKRACRGKLFDTILDWEHSLPEKDLEMSDYHSSVADLNICLGTTLQIVPSGNLPLRNKKYGGKLVIINLQPTKHDKKADLVINTYVDDVLENVFKILDLEIPSYSQESDLTKMMLGESWLSWDIISNDIKKIKEMYELQSKNFKKRKLEIKREVNIKVYKKREPSIETVIEIIDLT